MIRAEARGLDPKFRIIDQNDLDYSDERDVATIINSLYESGYLSYGIDVGVGEDYPFTLTVNTNRIPESILKFPMSVRNIFGIVFYSGELSELKFDTLGELIVSLF